jgi:hypothetical protein
VINIAVKNIELVDHPLIHIEETDNVYQRENYVLIERFNGKYTPEELFDKIVTYHILHDRVE